MDSHQKQVDDRVKEIENRILGAFIHPLVVEDPTSGGIKRDQGKPDLSMISYELLEEVAHVREFGAKKYTRYGDCVCCVKIVTELERYGLQNFVSLATTLKASNDAETDTMPTNENTERRTELPSELKNVSTWLGILGMKSEESDMVQRKDTTYQTRNWIDSFYRLFVQFVEELTRCASTTTTERETSEVAYVRRATLLLDSWKEMSGITKHSATCPRLKVISPGRNNWKKGFKVTRSCAAALRHIYQFLAGADKDAESGRSHLAHAVCALEHALYDMKRHPENDDRKDD